MMNTKHIRLLSFDIGIRQMDFVDRDVESRLQSKLAQFENLIVTSFCIWMKILSWRPYSYSWWPLILRCLLF